MITSQTLGTTLSLRHMGGQHIELAVSLVRAAATRRTGEPSEELLRRHVPSAADLDQLLARIG